MRAIAHARVIALGGTALAAAIVAMPALAQASAEDEGGLSEIVVTAQRREENLQDVPISINAITSESLTTWASGYQFACSAVPSLNFTRSGPSGIFVIRGVSTPNGAAGEEGSTAVYIDDVYMPDLTRR